jgi:CRP-like cAMP-binding protein
MMPRSQYHIAEEHSPLRDEAAADVLLSFREAGVPVLERGYEPRQTIYLSGEPDRHLYLLTEGVVEIYNLYGGHKKFTKALLQEGSVFSEPDLQVKGAHINSAEATTACRVATVGKAALEHHLLRDPKCSTALLLAYAQWAQCHERAIERLIPRTIPARLAVTVLELADRFGEPTKGGVAIGLYLTQQTLADLIASTRVSVSKEVARFRRKGLLDTPSKGEIIVLDRRKLRAIAGGEGSKSLFIE